MSMTGKAAVLATLALGSIASAQPCGGGGFWMNGPGRGGPGAPNGGQGAGMGGAFGLGTVLPVLMRLDLDEEQWSEIEVIMTDTREEIDSLEEASGGTDPRGRFLEAFGSPDLEVADFEELVDSMHHSRERIMEIEFDTLVRIHDVLTDGQLETVRSMTEEGPGAGCGGRRGCGR